MSNQKTNTDSSQSVDSTKALISIAQSNVDEVLHLFDTCLEGLSEAEAKKRLGKYGLNEIAHSLKIGAWRKSD